VAYRDIYKGNRKEVSQMGSINFWDWLYGLFFGSIPLSDDYEPQPGDRIAQSE